ncbi:putative 4-hydroxybenzoate polyprenyltransferase [Euryarchaeota archaeon]|nr:putative 4-hydroxybenzoate polyprenyltransferase [Euryarchaeota archaeon]
MKLKDILSFIKIEHTLFSLPFILIGYIIAIEQFPDTNSNILWIFFAAIGARGLAMTLNRIIDKDIDASNPRTKNRHLISGSISIKGAWILSIIFFLILIIGAGMLNKVALMMSWLPVLVFFIYPYTKRFTWLCHLWLGTCLALAPAGAWLAVAADMHGWSAITGISEGYAGLLWFPKIFFISIGVMLWITVFDINYAKMDIKNDKKNGIYSFPARFSEKVTTRTSVQLTLLWFACFAIADPINEIWFIATAGIMALVNIYVILSQEKFDDFQNVLFRVSMSTGWLLLISLILGSFKLIS